MRRRFEKRIYIPLPEPHARATLFKISLGDTPNELQPPDFLDLAQRTEGFSGSDISIVVREALMEPLRKCQVAKFFRKDPRTGMFSPIMSDPPCARCPPDLSTRPAPRKVPCPSCGCYRVGLYELESNELQVPGITMDDFRHIMRRAKATVATRELKRYDDFTNEFGEKGAETGTGGNDADEY
jgi:vacuolar protein-sorting-associated protein 4